MKDLISIVIPTYNEQGRIGPTLDQLHKYASKEKLNIEVLVVDASSPDDTIKEVNAHSKVFNKIKVIDVGPKPKGKFIKGLQVKKGVLEANGQYIIFMDADLATPLKYIKEAVSLMQSGSQLAICVRDLQKSHKGIRKLISGAGNMLVQMVLLPGIADTQCGFKGFTKESAQSIFPLQTIDSWGFDMEVLAIARKKGYTIGIIDVPDWHDIKQGSKISGTSPIKASIQTFGDLAKIRWQLIRGKYKK